MGNEVYLVYDGLRSLSGIFTVFSKYTFPLYCEEKYDEEFGVIMAQFFGKDLGRIAHVKLEDKEEHDKKMRQAFEDD